MRRGLKRNFFFFKRNNLHLSWKNTLTINAAFWQCHPRAAQTRLYALKRGAFPAQPWSPRVGRRAAALRRRCQRTGGGGGGGGAVIRANTLVVQRTEGRYSKIFFPLSFQLLQLNIIFHPHILSSVWTYK